MSQPNATSANENPASRGHAHHHHHHHAHGHGGDMAEANKHHFNANAADFENFPYVKERAAATAQAIREAVALTKDTSTVLDFACGPGLVSKELVPFVQEIVGIDISEALVERYNQRFKDEGANCSAVVANIMADKDVLSGRKFDVVFCASAYHHFEFPQEMSKLLAGYLKPGASLLIIDGLMKGGEEVQDEHKGCVTGYGFTEDSAKKLISGVEGLEFASFVRVPLPEEEIDAFLLKAVKCS